MNWKKAKRLLSILLATTMMFQMVSVLALTAAAAEELAAPISVLWSEADFGTFTAEWEEGVENVIYTIYCDGEEVGSTSWIKIPNLSRVTISAKGYFKDNGSGTYYCEVSSYKTDEAGNIIEKSKPCRSTELNYLEPAEQLEKATNLKWVIAPDGEVSVTFDLPENSNEYGILIMNVDTNKCVGNMGGHQEGHVIYDNIKRKVSTPGHYRFKVIAYASDIRDYKESESSFGDFLTVNADGTMVVTKELPKAPSSDDDTRDDGAAVVAVAAVGAVGAASAGAAVLAVPYLYNNVAAFKTAADAIAGEVKMAETVQKIEEFKQRVREFFRITA